MKRPPRRMKHGAGPSGPRKDGSQSLRTPEITKKLLAEIFQQTAAAGGKTHFPHTEHIRTEREQLLRLGIDPKFIRLQRPWQTKLYKSPSTLNM